MNSAFLESFNIFEFHSLCHCKIIWWHLSIFPLVTVVIFVSLLDNYIFLHLFFYSSWTWWAWQGLKQTFVAWFPNFILLNTLHKDRCPFNFDLLFQRKLSPKFSIILCFSPAAFWFGCFVLCNNHKKLVEGKTNSCPCQWAQGMDKGWWGASAPASPAMQKGCQKSSSSTIF